MRNVADEKSDFRRNTSRQASLLRYKGWLETGITVFCYDD